MPTWLWGCLPPGKEGRDELSRVMTELYAYRAGELWGAPNAKKLLVETVRAIAHNPPKPTPKDSRRREPRPWNLLEEELPMGVGTGLADVEGVPHQLARHVLLLPETYPGKSVLMGLLPWEWKGRTAGVGAGWDDVFPQSMNERSDEDYAYDMAFDERTGEIGGITPWVEGGDNGEEEGRLWLEEEEDRERLEEERKRIVVELLRTEVEGAWCEEEGWDWVIVERELGVEGMEFLRGVVERESRGRFVEAFLGGVAGAGAGVEGVEGAEGSPGVEGVEEVGRGLDPAL